MEINEGRVEISAALDIYIEQFFVFQALKWITWKSRVMQLHSDSTT